MLFQQLRIYSSKIPLDFVRRTPFLEITQHSGEDLDVLYERFILRRMANSKTTAGGPNPRYAGDFAIFIGTSNYKP